MTSRHRKERPAQMLRVLGMHRKLDAPKTQLELLAERELKKQVRAESGKRTREFKAGKKAEIQAKEQTRKQRSVEGGIKRAKAHKAEKLAKSSKASEIAIATAEAKATAIAEQKAKTDKILAALNKAKAQKKGKYSEDIKKGLKNFEETGKPLEAAAKSAEEKKAEKPAAKPEKAEAKAEVKTEAAAEVKTEAKAEAPGEAKADKKVK